MSRELRLKELVRFNDIDEFVGKEVELTGTIIGDYKAVKERYPTEYREASSESELYLVKVKERSGCFVVYRDDVLEVLEPKKETEMEDDEETDKPELKLIGEDGNVFFILGMAMRAMKKAGWDNEKIKAFQKEAMSGDYNNVLRLCSEHFEVV